MKIGLILCGALCLGLSTTAHALDCSDPNPGQSVAWKTFDSAVQSEYPLAGLDAQARAKIYGHALGRAQSAAANDTAKLKAIACIKKKMEQDSLSNIDIVMGGLSSEAYTITLDAARGRYDQEIEQLTAVNAETPLHKAFDGSLAAGPTVGGGKDGSGVRIVVRDGSRPTTDNQDPNAQSVQDLFGTESTSEGPNYDDLPLTPSGAHIGITQEDYSRRGFMSVPPQGVYDKARWNSAHYYHYCISLAKGATEGNDLAHGGLPKGYVQVLYMNDDNKFSCLTSQTPHQAPTTNAEMDRRAEALMKECQQATHLKAQWCKIWFLN